MGHAEGVKAAPSDLLCGGSQRSLLKRSRASTAATGPPQLSPLRISHLQEPPPSLLLPQPCPLLIPCQSRDSCWHPAPASAALGVQDTRLDPSS